MRFLKPNKEKIMIALFAYSLFYIMDVGIRSPLEDYFVPDITQEILSAPYSYWVIRFVYEIVSFYLIACFAYWFVKTQKRL